MLNHSWLLAWSRVSCSATFTWFSLTEMSMLSKNFNQFVEIHCLSPFISKCCQSNWKVKYNGTWLPEYGSTMDKIAGLELLRFDSWRKKVIHFLIWRWRYVFSFVFIVFIWCNLLLSCLPDSLLMLNCWLPCQVLFVSFVVLQNQFLKPVYMLRRIK